MMPLATSASKRDNAVRLLERVMTNTQNSSPWWSFTDAATPRYPLTASPLLTASFSIQGPNDDENAVAND